MGGKAAGIGVYKKLLAVQTALKAPKSQYNSFGKYNYRNVEDILEAAKPLCLEQNAVIYLNNLTECIGNRIYITAEAYFVDAETGETVVSRASAREDEVKKGMDGAQITGSASSYARKYALGGLLAVDDGRDSDSQPPDKQDKAKPAGSRTYFCACCKKSIQPVTRKDGTTWPVSEMAAYSRNRYGAELCGACMKKEDAKRNAE